MGALVYWPLKVLCFVCVCLCLFLCVISNQSTTKKYIMCQTLVKLTPCCIKYKSRILYLSCRISKMENLISWTWKRNIYSRKNMNWASLIVRARLLSEAGLKYPSINFHEISQKKCRQGGLSLLFFRAQ